MKAIIPVAGVGTKLRPLTYTQPKPLIPVAGKPIIAFIIDQLYACGITDFIFIIGYLGDKIEDYVTQQYPNIKKTFVRQPERLGLGHAIWMAKDEVDADDEVIVVLGDTIVDVDFQKFIDMPNSCLGIKKVEDPRGFGVVETNDDGLVTKVVEKPNIPKSNQAIVGLYKFSSIGNLLAALTENIQNDKKTYAEFQLTDGIMDIIEDGAKFTTMEVNNWYDCGKKEILLETNAMLLDRYNFFKSQEHDYENTIIIPPVSIGEHCEIKNSIVGPHVTIGANSSLDYAIIKETIIGNFATIQEVVLQNSIIGNDTIINGLKQSLNVGDNTEIDLS